MDKATARQVLFLSAIHQMSMGRSFTTGYAADFISKNPKLLSLWSDMGYKTTQGVGSYLSSLVNNEKKRNKLINAGVKHLPAIIGYYNPLGTKILVFKFVQPSDVVRNINGTNLELYGVYGNLVKPKLDVVRHGAVYTPKQKPWEY